MRARRAWRASQGPTRYFWRATRPTRAGCSACVDGDLLPVGRVFHRPACHRIVPSERISTIRRATTGSSSDERRLPSPTPASESFDTGDLGARSRDAMPSCDTSAGRGRAAGAGGPGRETLSLDARGCGLWRPASVTGAWPLVRGSRVLWRPCCSDRASAPRPFRPGPWRRCPRRGARWRSAACNMAAFSVRADCTGAPIPARKWPCA